MPWWVWAIAAAAIGFAELHVPGSYLIWIAAGAAATAAFQAIWDLRLENQLIAFVVCSLLACLGGYHVYRTAQVRASGETPLNQRNQSMVGARGTVSSRIVNGEGKVRMGDTVWLAEGPDLPEDAPVVVISVRGARLMVKADGA